MKMFIKPIGNEDADGYEELYDILASYDKKSTADFSSIIHKRYLNFRNFDAWYSDYIRIVSKDDKNTIFAVYLDNGRKNFLFASVEIHFNNDKAEVLMDIIPDKKYYECYEQLLCLVKDYTFQKNIREFTINLDVEYPLAQQLILKNTKFDKLEEDKYIFHISNEDIIKGINGLDIENNNYIYVVSSNYMSSIPKNTIGYSNVYELLDNAFSNNDRVYLYVACMEVFRSEDDYYIAEQTNYLKCYCLTKEEYIEFKNSRKVYHV